MKNQLVATNPAEMAIRQDHLIDHFSSRMKESEAETLELANAVAEAKNAGLKAPALANRYRLSRKKTQYFEKLRAAVRSGYYVIPNLPITVFGIRTDKQTPNDNQSGAEWAEFQQLEAQLPINEGEYVNPIPEKAHYVEDRTDSDGKPYKKKWYYPVAFKNTASLPGRIDSTRLIQPIKQAMDLMIFDDIGMAPQTVGDPMIIGRIRRPGRRPDEGQQSANYVCFLIAWFVDPEIDF